MYQLWLLRLSRLTRKGRIAESLAKAFRWTHETWLVTCLLPSAASSAGTRKWRPWRSCLATLVSSRLVGAGGVGQTRLALQVASTASQLHDERATAKADESKPGGFDARNPQGRHRPAFAVDG